MNLPQDFKDLLDSVTNKRARFVIDTIMKKGFCSTEDLKNGGYEHAPRAARDVRELGIPLDTFKIKDTNGKNIAAYKFGNWEVAKNQNLLAKTGGRTQLTEKLKQALINRYGSKCHLYGEYYPSNLLQPDHRVPYEIGGDPVDMMDTDYFMLLSPSANRDKSWACEHCPNWTVKNIEMCRNCYYAYPENYQHIASREERHLNLVFSDQDMYIYDALVKYAQIEHISSQDFAKRLLKYVSHETP